MLHIVTDKRPVGPSPYIEIGIMSMHSDKHTAKTLTKPVTDFGLYPQMTEAFAVGKFPRIIIDRNIQRPFTRQSDLQSQIHGSSSVIQQIAFQRNLLGMTLGNGTSEHE